MARCISVGRENQDMIAGGDDKKSKGRGWTLNVNLASSSEEHDVRCWWN